MIPLLRTLTRKSKLGFGKWKDYTVQELIDLRKKDVLISPYFKLTSINYTTDILDEIGIKEEFRIEKPSSNKEEYYRFMNSKNGNGGSRKHYPTNVMKKQKKLPSKGFLQSKNQGK